MRALASTRNDAQGNHLYRWMLLILYFLAMSIAANVSAQERGKEEEIPKPRELKLTTKDDVGIRAAYFPSLEGKDAITVLIVHELKGQLRPYSKLG